MACLPIIERELRVALRKRKPERRRLYVAVGCAAVSLLFIWFGALFRGRTIGHNLHQLLCAVALYFILRAPMLTAGALAEERRNQTIGLLFLSGLSAGEVFVSKFLSATLLACTELLAIFPMLALPFLIGGVSFDLFLATICGLPVLLLLAVAVSLLASVLSRDEGAAVVLAVVLAVILCGLPQMIYMAQSHFSPGGNPSPWWLRLSPAYGPRLVWRGLPAVSVPEFWRNLAMSLCWSVLCLGAASFALNRLWREREEDQGAAGWRERCREFLHGSRQRRRGLAARWLDVNPFSWLGAYDRRPAIVAWALIVGIVLGWLTCWALWGRRWPSAPNFFLTATLLNVALGWISRYTAAKMLAGPRQDGSYELLLTTPLNPSNITWGEFEALTELFRPLSRAILCLETIMVLAGLLVRPWNSSALAVYFIAWFWLLLWTWSQGRNWPRLLPVMWTSLNCGRPAWAAWRASGFNSWSWIWIVFNLNSLSRGLPTFPSGSTGEVALFSAFSLLGIIVVVAAAVARRRTSASNEHRLVAEFREIVREPLPDTGDPRFKKWNIRDRFPWGWDIVQQQLHERLARR